LYTIYIPADIPITSCETLIASIRDFPESK